MKQPALIMVLIAMSALGARAQPSTQPDALQAKTIWTGHISGDERTPNRDAERGAVLRVTSRDGALGRSFGTLNTWPH